MVASAKGFVSKLSIEEAEKELEFLVNQCFISGFTDRLTTIFNSSNSFFHSPEEEESQCKGLEEAIKNGGQIVSIPRKAPAEYKRDAEESYSVLVNIYKALPWEHLINADGSQRKPIYAPLVKVFAGLLELGALLPKVFIDQRNMPPELGIVSQKIIEMAKWGDEFYKSVMLLQKYIKESTGQQPVHKAGYEIHRGYTGHAQV